MNWKSITASLFLAACAPDEGRSLEDSTCTSQAQILGVGAGSFVDGIDLVFDPALSNVEGVVEKLALAYVLATQTSDSFSRHAEYITRLQLQSSHVFLRAAVSAEGLLTVYGAGDEEEDEESMFVHEGAHLWHDDLIYKNEFEERWSAIVRVEYDYELCGAYAPRDENCLQLAHEVASATRYGASSLEEDVACVAQLVYNLTNQNYFVVGFPGYPLPFLRQRQPIEYFLEDHAIILENIPRLMQKVELLGEYGFISMRERDHVLQELADFEGE